MKKLITFLPALFYGLIISVRNVFYDWGWFTSYHFDKPKTVVVGNIAVGGTGKSPLVAYLIKKSPWNNSLGILSRGYGRSTNGFKWVYSDSTSDEVGDEPLTYKTTFPNLPVAVCESRVLGIQKMIVQMPGLETVILDDAFQHRALKADINIVCTTFDQPYFDDHLMPMGRLREWRDGIKRANIVVVTRCPVNLTKEQSDLFRTNIPKPVFFASIRYGKPIGIESNTIRSWHALAGIADPRLFFDQVESLGELKSIQSFPDHHRFTRAELENLNIKAMKMEMDEAFITTQKDFVRFQTAGKDFPELVKKITYLPMEMYFLDAEEEFWLLLNQGLMR